MFVDVPAWGVRGILFLCFPWDFPLSLWVSGFWFLKTKTFFAHGKRFVPPPSPRPPLHPPLRCSFHFSSSGPSPPFPPPHFSFHSSSSTPPPPFPPSFPFRSSSSSPSPYVPPPPRPHQLKRGANDKVWVTPLWLCRPNLAVSAPPWKLSLKSTTTEIKKTARTPQNARRETERNKCQKRLWNPWIQNYIILMLIEKEETWQCECNFFCYPHALLHRYIYIYVCVYICIYWQRIHINTNLFVCVAQSFLSNIIRQKKSPEMGTVETRLLIHIYIYIYIYIMVTWVPNHLMQQESEPCLSLSLNLTVILSLSLFLWDLSGNRWERPCMQSENPTSKPSISSKFLGFFPDATVLEGARGMAPGVVTLFATIEFFCAFELGYHKR